MPEGRLQPYVFGGPTVFVSMLDFEVTAATGLGPVSVRDSATLADVGFTAGGGIAFMFTRNIGAFGEYRYTYNRPDFEIAGAKVEPHGRAQLGLEPVLREQEDLAVRLPQPVLLAPPGPLAHLAGALPLLLLLVVCVGMHALLHRGHGHGGPPGGPGGQRDGR